jgi:hypothetical protein
MSDFSSPKQCYCLISSPARAGARGIVARPQNLTQNAAKSVAKLVLPGLVPGIHVLVRLSKKDVDGRDKPGHDEKQLLRRLTSAGHKVSGLPWRGRRLKSDAISLFRGGCRHGAVGRAGPPSYADHGGLSKRRRRCGSGPASHRILLSTPSEGLGQFSDILQLFKSIDE